LFGEDQSRIIVTTSHALELLALCSEKEVYAEQIGIVGGKTLSIDGIVSLEVPEMARGYGNSVENAIEML
jgi:hypothetical protein